MLCGIVAFLSPDRGDFEIVVWVDMITSSLFASIKEKIVSQVVKADGYLNLEKSKEEKPQVSFVDP